MISFTVLGNPIGYTRTTQSGCKFDERYKRYQDYKDRVKASFLDQVPGDWGPVDIKPLTSVKGSKTRLNMQIYFANYVHPDPDNVFKAILDSLFECDKFCCGTFDFSYDKTNPRVEIEIS